MSFAKLINLSSSFKGLISAKASKSFETIIKDVRGSVANKGNIEELNLGLEIKPDKSGKRLLNMGVESRRGKVKKVGRVGRVVRVEFEERVELDELV
jgi:hypothetical protein